MRYQRTIVLSLALAAFAVIGAVPAFGSTPAGGGSAYSGGSGPGSSQGAGSQGDSAKTGGAGVQPGPGPANTPQHPVVQGFKAKIVHGLAYAPSDAPIQVQRAIWAGDKIRHKPYIYGGGHGAWEASGYDCSGSVSFVLHAAGLLRTSMDSSEFMSWGQGGKGQWITVYTNPSHAFVEIAGIRFDTSSLDDPHPPPGSGPRWRPLAYDTQGFETRHPSGL